MDHRGQRRLLLVQDNIGQALAYVYSEQDPGRRTAANLLKRDEARRIPAAVYRRGEQRAGSPGHPVVQSTPSG